MRHPRILTSQDAILLIIDVQESMRRYLSDISNLTRNISILVEAAKILKLPIFMTEQYPQGLGKTLCEIVACLGEHSYFEKVSFSCALTDGFMDQIESTGRKQVLVCGIEAHVCVNQTVHDLLNSGYMTHLIVDAISSRSLKNKEIAVEKMIDSGAVRSSVEIALFEMLNESGTEAFKAIQRLIK